MKVNSQANIGQQLKLTREERGECLLDVEHATRIPYRLLNDLEQNDYENFPDPTYAKRFLSLYSHYLHIDASHWLQAFETRNPLANIRKFEYLHLNDPELTGNSDTSHPYTENGPQVTSTVAHSIGATICIAIIGTGLYFYNHFETRFANIEANAAQAQIEQKQDLNVLATQSAPLPTKEIIVTPEETPFSSTPKAEALTPEELAALGIE